MIRKMIINNVECTLDLKSVHNDEDGFYNRHFEDWDVVNRETGAYLGFVTFIEDVPEVSRYGEKYRMQVFFTPQNDEMFQGFNRYYTLHSRLDILEKVVKFMKNNN